MKKCAYIIIFLFPFIGLSQYWNAQIYFDNIKLDFRSGSDVMFKLSDEKVTKNPITNFSNLCKNNGEFYFHFHQDSTIINNRKYDNWRILYPQLDTVIIYPSENTLNNIIIPLNSNAARFYYLNEGYQGGPSPFFDEPDKLMYQNFDWDIGFPPEKEVYDLKETGIDTLDVFYPIPHINPNKHWIITYHAYFEELRSYLADEKSNKFTLVDVVSTKGLIRPEVSTQTQNIPEMLQYETRITSSPNSQYFVLEKFETAYDDKYEKELFKFNNSTGEMNHAVSLDEYSTPTRSIGEIDMVINSNFSSNSRYLYSFLRYDDKIIKYDLSNLDNIQESKITLSSYSPLFRNIASSGERGSSILGMDGKIYIWNLNDHSKDHLFYVINRPDSKNSFEFDSLYFEETKGVYSDIDWITFQYPGVLNTRTVSYCSGEDVFLNNIWGEKLVGTNFRWELDMLHDSLPELEEKIREKLKEFEGNPNPVFENADHRYSGRYLVRWTDTLGFDRNRLIVAYIDSLSNAEIVAEKISGECEPTRYILKPDTIIDDFTYWWSTGEETPEIEVDENGEYTLYVETSQGCLDSTSIDIEFSDEDVYVNIEGADGICRGESVILSSNRDFESYLWSTGETTKSIEVSEPDEYILTIVNKDSCVISDTLDLKFHPLVSAEIKPTATEICEGDSTFLESKYLAPYFEYYWNTGDSTHSIYVKESGDYQLLITDKRTGCKDSTEITINVEDKLEPKIEGKDICGNETVTLTAIPNDESYSYEWNTGESTPNIEVSEAGEYSVIVTKDNCSGEAQFTVEQHPLPEFTIEGDIIVCEGETTTLIASKEFDKFEWSNGETTRSITVGEGDYTLTVTDSNGCTASREIEVEEKNTELAFESMKYDFGKVYISENRDTTIEITNNSGEEVTAIIGGDQVNIPEDGYTHQYNLDNSSMGAKQDFITIQVTEPCEAEYQIEITAKVYARVTLSTIELHTEIVATETIPYYIEAEADLGEQEFNITTDIERDLFFTNDSYQIPSPQAINQQRTQVHEQTGTILLAELYEYPITFPQVEFDNPYIEKDTIPGMITFDEICIHDLRLIHTYAPTEVSIAPNPARDIINIDITTGEEGNFTIELISTEGRTTYTDSWNQSSSSKNLQIDTRDISTGVYQLRLTTEGHIYRKEVVVVE